VSDSIRIREFEPTSRDYDAVARINAQGADEFLDFEPDSAAELRDLDASFDPARYVLRRYVAEDLGSGDIVAYAFYSHTPWAFDPHLYWVSVRCAPSHRRRGLGSRLYSRIVQDLERIGATCLWAEAREGDEVAGGALLRRGFSEILKSAEYVLKTSGLDLDAFHRYRERADGAGVEILSLPVLAERDAGWLPKLHALHNSVMTEIPLPDELYPYRPLPLFQEYLCGLPQSLPDACFVALLEDRYVGECVIHRSQDDATCLDHLITGVDRDYRGRGVAMALKLRSIEYALASGYDRISTYVESNNPSMLEINRKLGFVRGDALVIFEKRLAPPP
jgi:mycothiol synthase